MESLGSHFKHKIKSAAEIAAIIGAPPRRRKVIMCHGVFDVVHPGHLRHLLYAKSKADILIASLTADHHIAKGRYRPHVPQDLRAINLAAFEIVDYVIIDPEPTPLKNLALIKPDIFAKGYEYQYLFCRNAGHSVGNAQAQFLPHAIEWVWRGYALKKSE